MIVGALIADAVIGNVQEKAMKSHSASNIEVVSHCFDLSSYKQSIVFFKVYFSYSIGFIYILVGVTVSGQIFDAVKYCSEVKATGFVAFNPNY